MRMGELGDEADSSLTTSSNVASIEWTFVVATKKLEQLSYWVKVSEVFKADDSTRCFLTRAGITGFGRSSPWGLDSQRLARHRRNHFCKYVYRMDVPERTLSYEEVTEISSCA